MMEIDHRNELELLSPCSGDVYLVAYPKAGVTWMTEVVTAIYREYAAENPNVSDQFENAVRAHAFCDVCPMSRRRSNVDKTNKDRQVVGFDANGNEVYDSDEETQRRRRIVSLHFPAKRMEKMMPDAFNNKNVKLIYVARNPKDIAVSYYHFHRMNDALPTPASWDEFLGDFMSGNVRWGSWFDHVRGWWKKHEEMKLSNKRSEVLWLTFESLKKDLKKGVASVCDHLGLKLSEKGQEAVVRRCTFASMKADPVRNHSRNNIFKGDFLRKGKVGDWEKQFTVEQSKNFDRALIAQLEEDFANLGKNFNNEEEEIL